MKKNIIKIFSIILTVCLLTMPFCVTGFANDEQPEDPISICSHENVRVERTKIQDGDCYHYEIFEVKNICEDCGDTLATYNESTMEYIHGEIERVNLSVPPTCVAPGWFIIREYCKLCGQNVGGATQPMVGVQHPVNADGTADCYETIVTETPATCTEDGERVTVVWCNECEIEVSRNTEIIPATGHEWSEWKESDGKLVRTCSNCNETESKEMEQENPVLKMIETIKSFFESIMNFFNKLFKF